MGYPCWVPILDRWPLASVWTPSLTMSALGPESLMPFYLRGSRNCSSSFYMMPWLISEFSSFLRLFSWSFCHYSLCHRLQIFLPKSPTSLNVPESPGRLLVNIKSIIPWLTWLQCHLVYIPPSGLQGYHGRTYQMPVKIQMFFTFSRPNYSPVPHHFSCYLC